MKVIVTLSNGVKVIIEHLTKPYQEIVRSLKEGKILKKQSLENAKYEEGKEGE